MTEPREQPQDDPGESVVRRVAGTGQPGSEFDTREMPILADIPADESVVRAVVDPSQPGSALPTRVMPRDEFETIERRVADQQSPGSDLPTGYFRREDFEDLETREVPALSDEWRDRAGAAAAALGEDAEVVGEVKAAPASAGAATAFPNDDTPAVRPIYDAARKAQQGWAALRFEQRLPKLDALRAELVIQRNDYVPTLATAVGRPMVEALCGEYLPVLEALRAMEDVVPPLLYDHFGAASPSTSQGATNLVRNVPWGVVLILTPSDAPFALPMVLACDALAAGNAVVLCPGERHPRVAENLRKLFVRAGFPDGLIQVMGGQWRDRRSLVEGGPDLVVFEGVQAEADHICRAGAEHGFGVLVGRATKELLAVMPGADIGHAVRAALWAAYAGGGFARGRVERIVLHQSMYDEFRMRFLEGLRTLNSHHAQLAAIADSLNQGRFQKLLSDATDKGARVTWPAGEEPGRWIHWKGGVMENLPDRALASTERMEGPACALYRADDVAAEVLRLHRVSPASTLSVLGTPSRADRAALEQVPVSRICFGEPILNGGSFTAHGADGLGLPRGASGPRMMLRPQVVIESPGDPSRIGWFPYTDDKAYALMEAIEAEYHTDRAKRIKAGLKFSLNGHKRRLLRGQE
ncbi:MAG: aldehyde dehydrogenase family protein [Planctomycetes bacterium]|nr:aldehyde dehydrogenase family protein [Planctomycetota bacterium]